MDLASAIVLGAYVALAAELRFIAVPSSVSTRQLLSRPEADSVGAKLALAAPITGILLLFLIPPVAALFPGVIDDLIPIRALAVPAVRWFGVGLLVLGKLLPLLAVPVLRRALDEGRLARSGLFLRSRHPVLLGMLAFYLGNALVFPCAVLFVGFPLYVLHMHRRALMEEADLRVRFPHEYDEYAAHVPRYVGLRSFSTAL